MMCYYLMIERKKGLCQTAVFPVWTQSPGLELLGLIYKRLAVCTFLHGRIGLVSTYLDRFKSTVILVLGMVSAVIDCTMDTFVLSVN